MISKIANYWRAVNENSHVFRVVGAGIRIHRATIGNFLMARDFWL
jgi:hypothetical protein